MKIIRHCSEMQELAANIQSKKKSIGFVPTMGALHEAHVSLLNRAREESDVLIASIFVNPLQFGPNEDYDKYPKCYENDEQICLENNVDFLFIPQSADMYSSTFASIVKVNVFCDSMCAKSRPGHFDGVATVLVKLFNIIKPQQVYLGQKDYQQFMIVKQFISDLNYDIDLRMCKTIREKNGLAMSSRNRYLTVIEKEQASYIYKALCEGKKIVKESSSGKVASAKIKEIMLSKIPGCQIEYAGVYDCKTLCPVENVESDIVIAAALKLGKARLIDNICVEYEK